MGEGSEGSRLEVWMKSHKSEVAITFICTPTRKQCLCWKRHKKTKHLEHESNVKSRQQQLSNKYSSHVVYLWVTIIHDGNCDKMINNQAHKLCA